jgi:apolipoprotein N-acyltransferase
MKYNAAAMTLSRTARLLLALVSGVALALAFPAFHVALLGWIAPAVLILAVLNESPWFALLLGLLQGVVFYALSVPFIYTVLRQYGPLTVTEAGAVFALTVFVLAASHAAFGFGVAWLSRSGTGRACFAAPFLWVSLELLLLHLPAIGYPWNLLGYVAGGNLALVQLTTITGIFGLSLLVAFYNALTAWMILQISRRSKRGLAIWIGATAALIVAGVAGSKLVPQAAADHVAHLVQTNLPVAMSYPADWMQTHAPELDQLEQISINAAQKMPGVVVWPEVPAPFSLQDARFLTRATRIARGAGGGFLLGVVDWKPLGGGRIGANNSAALLDSTGALNFVYDKIHLVPFSEYVPWRNWLTFAGGLTGLIGDFQHGSQYTVGRMAGGPFSVYICYEAIFPNEVRRFTLAGAALLVNISDDAWFGRSAAAAQHLEMARVRAVENRRWLLRDTNNGITVSVDPYGRIVARLAANIRGELDAPYGFRTGLTFYTRWGDWLAWLCVITTLMLLLFGVRDALANRSRRTRRGGMNRNV